MDTSPISTIFFSLQSRSWRCSLANAQAVVATSQGFNVESHGHSCCNVASREPEPPQNGQNVMEIHGKPKNLWLGYHGIWWGSANSPQKTKCLVYHWDIFVGKMGRFGRFCGAYTQQYDDLVIGFGLNTGYICPKKGLEYGKCWASFSSS